MTSTKLQQVRELDSLEAVIMDEPRNGSSKHLSKPPYQSDLNQLDFLGEKIFLDRYALKDGKKESLKVGDTVIVCIDLKTGQREIGEVQAINKDRIRILLREGDVVERSIEHVDKPIEVRPEQMMERVARGLASIEKPEKKSEWFENFRWLLDDWKFVPAGRILAAAGTDQALTYYNCYVIPSPKDSRRGIIETLSQMTEIMSRGGGVGINVSSLRPRHSYVRGVNGRSSGAVSWGALYSFVTGLIEQGGSRRGALMLILGVWHPDVLEFITSKREMGKITNANISVAVTDDFMAAVERDADWDLVFPDTAEPDYEQVWDGDLAKWRSLGKPVKVYKTVKARDIWNNIIESAWASAEPGVFFIDRYNAMSNSHYFARILCTNPCGEQGLPAWGVCNLGAINLGRFVHNGIVEWEELSKCVRYAVRFLDNVIDATPYFFDENKQQQLSERRVGMGTMGLAEMLIKLGIRYGSSESVAFIDKLYGFIVTEAYLASSEYAAEKGAFPKFDADKFLESGFMKTMPEKVRKAVKENGIRNVTLITQAPTGTTGTMVGTSTGIEPFFSWSYFRKSRLGMHEVNVKVYEEWKAAHPNESLPPYFVTAMELSPEEHIRVEAAIQKWTDSSISKTCNIPADYTVDQTRELYELMYRLGCKGGTVYRDKSRDEQILHLKESPVESKSKATAHSDSQPKIRPRPYKRRGVTVSRSTPIGTAHITMNDDEAGNPFEVFIEIGKAGSDVKAMAEAMGRLISLLLRVDSSVSPIERVREIVGQIKGIGGARTLGFGKNKVLSLPDAVGQVIEEHYLGEAPSNGSLEKANNGTHDAPLLADICPECGNSTYVRQNGCMNCQICGYSEC